MKRRIEGAPPADDVRWAIYRSPHREEDVFPVYIVASTAPATADGGMSVGMIRRGMWVENAGYAYIRDMELIW